MNMCGWGSYYREKNTEEAGLIRVHECRIDKDVKSAAIPATLSKAAI